MKGFILDYINENEYKKLERALKKYNMLAYKKLNFEYYPALRSGNFVGELKLPSDLLFTQVHGEVKVRYIVYKEQNVVMLETIMPTDILLEGHVAELNTYKGVMISKQNSEKDKFLINLFSAMDQK